MMKLFDNEQRRHAWRKNAKGDFRSWQSPKVGSLHRLKSNKRCRPLLSSPIQFTKTMRILSRRTSRIIKDKVECIGIFQRILAGIITLGVSMRKNMWILRKFVGIKERQVEENLREMYLSDTRKFALTIKATKKYFLFN